MVMLKWYDDTYKKEFLFNKHVVPSYDTVIKEEQILNEEFLKDFNIMYQNIFNQLFGGNK